MDKKREFVLDDKRYFVKYPSAEVIRAADWEFSKSYNKALIDGIATASEMRSILEKRGIISQEHSEQRDRIVEELEDVLENMRSEKDIYKKRDSAIDAKIKRNELFNWDQRINEPLSNTVEQLAEESKVDYLVFSMIEDENGKNTWSSYQDFLKDKNHDLSGMAKYQAILMLRDIDPDFLDKTEENVVLKEILSIEAMSRIEEENYGEQENSTENEVSDSNETVSTEIETKEKEVKNKKIKKVQ